MCINFNEDKGLLSDKNNTLYKKIKINYEIEIGLKARSTAKHDLQLLQM